MDGTSWLNDVEDQIIWGVTDGTCCEYRHIDIRNSRSIVNSEYQYIWRANDDVEKDDLYPCTFDEQQLYDLTADPDQTINLIADYESYRDEDSSGDLSSTITMFQEMMREYVDETCPAADGVCDKPALTFCEEVVDDYSFFHIVDLDEETTEYILAASIESFESDHPNCTVEQFWYNMTVSAFRTTYLKVLLDVDVCCGEDGAVWPGDHEYDAEYTLYDPDTDTDSETSSVAVPTGSSPITVIDVNPMAITIALVFMLMVLAIGCVCGRWLARVQMLNGVKMMKLQEADSEEEEDLDVAGKDGVEERVENDVDAVEIENEKAPKVPVAEKHPFLAQ